MAQTPPKWTLALEPGPATPLATVTAAVTDRWAEAVRDGAMSEQTLDKLVQLVGRFERFAYAHAIAAIGEIDHDLVRKFVTAKGRSRKDAVSAPAAATQANRRSAIRALYRTARQAGLLLDDPTTELTLPGRSRSAQRPITTDEAAMIRLFSERDRPTRHASTAALLLAGAHTAELGYITTTDIDLNAGNVRVHGSSRHQPRVLPIDSWSTRVLTARIEFLLRPLSPDDRPPVVCTGAEGSDAHKQARVCVTVREILTRAGLSDDRTILPSSLTAYAAQQEFQRTGRIESAAAVLGSASLDTTATLIGYHWR